MKLYHAARTRSVRPRWLLEEMGVPYELVRLDMSKGEHKQPSYLAVHPHGAVPALQDGELSMYESAAICMYLADKYPDRKLCPPPGTAARGMYYQWVVYSIATLEPPLIQIFQHTIMLPEDKRSPQAAEEAKKDFAAVARVLSDALSGKQFLLGDTFSAADVMIGSTLAWAAMLGLLSDFPVLQDYVARLTQRPAYQKAVAD